MAESKYSVTLAANDGYSRQFRDFGEASEEFQRGVRAQQAELRELNRQAKSLDGYQQLKGDLDATSAALNEARERQAGLAREMRQAETPSKRLKNEYDKTTASVASLTAEQRAQTNELGRLEGSLESAGVDLSRFADEQRRIEVATDQANAALNTQRDRMNAVSDAQDRVDAAQGRVDANAAQRSQLRGEMVETLALGYIATRPISAAMEFEGAMAGVSKLVGFDSPDEEARMASDIKKLSTDRTVAAGGLDAIGIAEIITAAAQSAVPKDELIPFAKDAAQMATAFDMSAKMAGETMMQWRAAMNLDQAAAMNLADTVNYVADRTKNVNPAMVSEVLRRQGAVAMTAGFNERQAAGLAAALLSSGAGPEIAATAMKNATGALTKGGAATKSQREAMNQLGFAPEQLARDMQADAPETMMRVLSALQEQPAEEVNALISQLFGEESKGAIAPLLVNLDNLSEAFTNASDTAAQNGSMQEEAARQATLHGTSWERFTNTMARLSTVVGTAMLPYMTAVLEPLSDAANLVADFAEENQGLVGAGAALLGGLVALKAGVLGVRYAALLFGQLGNRGSLARAKLNARTAQTALRADAAVMRLNATMGRLGAGGAMGGRGRRGSVGGAPRTGGWRGGAPGQGQVFMPMAGGPQAGAVAKTGWKGRLAGLNNLAQGMGDSRAAKIAGRAAMPLMLLAGSASAASAASEGDAEGVGGAVGGMAGSLGGGWAGAAGGAAIGTMIFPGVGTAIGGAIGGIAGSIAGTAAGEWIGEKAGSLWNWATDDDESSPASQLDSKLTAPPDMLAAPNEVASEIKAGARSHTDARVISPTFDIKLEASGNEERDRALVDQLMERLRSEMMPMLSTGDGLDARLDASLTDRSD